MSRTAPLRTLEAVALVAVGGFVGSNLRFLLAHLVPGAPGTLLVNALGSGLLGVLLYAGLYAGTLSDESRTVLATGVLASFTTYSTFAMETAGLGTPGWMLATVAASYALGFAGVLAGRAVARALVGEARA